METPSSHQTVAGQQNSNLESLRPGEMKKREEFWVERKLSFVQLKVWEDGRMNVCHNLATVVIGMLGVLFQRLENSATENETFVQYFESYIKIWNSHSEVVEKNTKKFLSPMRLEHQKQNSQFQDFLTQVENMDLVYA